MLIVFSLYLVSSTIKGKIVKITDGDSVTVLTEDKASLTETLIYIIIPKIS
ncbi:hypothetical protein GGR21_003560 [Dysgonomonas hofstadii]|uniref:Uncharacterized protein n=1 Tax=Dysgonomonas hofstadii TaxID=637886 RepID=A0A840CNR1_9BACT|nr:hypothetical protein [Dysgonomonas hofstadii]